MKIKPLVDFLNAFTYFSITSRTKNNKYFLSNIVNQLHFKGHKYSLFLDKYTRANGVFLVNIYIKK